MSGVDKARLAAAFSRGAEGYDAHATLQREVVRGLVARLRGALAAPPRRALDVGAGTGGLLEALVAAWPGLAAAGVDLAPGMVRAARARTGPVHVVGDAERLPIASERLDLVASASTYQWIADLPGAFAEARRTLRPGGTFAVALFGGETLRELRDAWRAALPSDGHDHTHAFHGAADVERSLRAAGFCAVSVEVERHVEHHADALALVRAIERIGAGNASPRRAGGLGARGTMRRMAASYERLRGPRGLPATWDVVHALARR